MTPETGAPAVTPVHLEPRRATAPLAIIRLLRPRQWVKNVLVFAAPAAAGVLHRPTDVAEALVALVAFCLVASGTYCLNDAADAERDRAHPTKRFRPVASGEVGVPTARLLGACLLGTGLVVSTALHDWRLPLVTLTYVALTTSYTIWLKHLPVIDVAAVAAGFVIRAIAGAVATHVHVSNWFLIVASFGSLLMVAGKRSCERREADATTHRSVLSEYPAEYLSHLRVLSAGMTLLAYTLFAFERAAAAATSLPLFQLSVLPFVLAVLLYLLRLDQGQGGAPEDLVLGDRALQVLGVAWALLFLAGVYAR